MTSTNLGADVPLAKTRPSDRERNRELRDAALSGGPAPNNLTPTQIVETVACLHGLDPTLLYSRSRRRPYVKARQEAQLALRQYTSMSLEEIGAMFGRDHTTVHYAIEKAAEAKGIAVPPAPVRRRPRRRRRCEVEGCRRPHEARGMCGQHDRRTRRHGDPLAHVPIGELVRQVREPRWTECEGCGRLPLGGSRWCAVGGCGNKAGRWSWSRGAA